MDTLYDNKHRITDDDYINLCNTIMKENNDMKLVQKYYIFNIL